LQKGEQKMEVMRADKMRKEWAESDALRDAGLTTPDDIERFDNISYGQHGVWNLMDIYTLKNNTKKLPVIISIHGGGWVYGTKEIYQFYCMSLAQRGFTVVNFNYRLAPENRYPAALEDINNLFCWVKENGEQYRMDINNVFTVGDSAGAQLSTHYIALMKNKNYQKYYDFIIPEDMFEVRAAGLNCGIYDMPAHYDENNGEGIVRDYFGDEFESKRKEADVLSFINEDFPPSYILTAFHDFARPHAKPMYDFLKQKGIECKLAEYGSKEQPKVAHVFHVDMKQKEAHVANDDQTEFFKKYLNV